MEFKLKRYYPRDEWDARKPKPEMARQNPANIREAFVHHSDDQHGNQWSTMHQQIAKMHDIQDFHMSKWSDIGYHFVIFQWVGGKAQARIFEGRPIGFVPAAQLNHNTNTLAICVIGNGNAEIVQRNTRYQIESLLKQFPQVRTIGGHRDVVATSCPGDQFYKSIPQIAKAAKVGVFRR